jgi:predicted nucleotidyltransferase
MQEVIRSEFDCPEAVIHLFIGGSELHGAKVGATDDLDLYGVFLDGPAWTLGLEPRSHFVWSMAADDRRNGPEDVDRTLYSLRRWAQLAAKGNATALHFVFADATATSDELWGMVQAQRELFICKQSAVQFIGFAGNQLRRITGEQGRGAKGRRPEYESVFGYDTKAAMHCLRLYLECIELMRLGTITLPRQMDCVVRLKMRRKSLLCLTRSMLARFRGLLQTYIWLRGRLERYLKILEFASVDLLRTSKDENKQRQMRGSFTSFRMTTFSRLQF